MNSFAWIMKLADGKVIDGTAFYDSVGGLRGGPALDGRVHLLLAGPVELHRGLVPGDHPGLRHLVVLGREGERGTQVFPDDLQGSHRVQQSHGHAAAKRRVGEVR